MKAIIEIRGKKVPPFYINPELNKYNNVVLFPEKLAEAEETIKNSNLVEFIKQWEESKVKDEQK